MVSVLGWVVLLLLRSIAVVVVVDDVEARQRMAEHVKRVEEAA